MYCPKCGKEMPEGAQFCPSCGNSVSPPEAPAQEPSGHDRGIPSPEQPGTPPVSNEEIKCPRCGASGCVPQYKQNVSGGGYGCCQGILGSLILGPLGLLCGMCGRSTKTTNNLVWICPKCGHEFRAVTKESVLSNLVLLVVGVELLIGGLLCVLAGGTARNGEGLILAGFLCAAVGLCLAVAAKSALPEDPLTYITDAQMRRIKIIAVIEGVIFVGFPAFTLLIALMAR